MPLCIRRRSTYSYTPIGYFSKWHEGLLRLRFCLTSTSLLQSRSDFLCLKHTDVNRKTDKSPVVCCAGMPHVVRQQQDPGELSPIADHRSQSSLWHLTRSVGSHATGNPTAITGWSELSFLFIVKWCRTAMFNQLKKCNLFVSECMLELLKCKDLVLKLVIYEFNKKLL